MGIVSAPFYLQRAMSQVLAGLLGLGVFLYLDDIVIVGDDEEDFLSNYLAVLQRLDQYHLRLNANKCIIGVSELPLLGHVVDGSGIRQSPDRIAALLNVPMPRSTRELRRFLGATNFMRRFIPNYGIIAAPLIALTTGDKKALQSASALTAFEALKAAVAGQINVCHLDYSLPLVVSTDASILGIGATLSNLHPDGSRRVVACISHKFTKAESRWKTIEQEAFAMVYALQHWRDILYGHHFILETDHRNLTYIHGGSSPKLTRWLLILQEFSYGTVHLDGESNVLPDLTSRYPLSGSSSPVTVAADLSVDISPAVIPSAISSDEGESFPITLDDFEEESLSDLDGLVPALSRRLGMARRSPRRGAVPPPPPPALASPTTLPIPEKDRRACFDRVHNSTLGHLGINRTLHLLQERGWTWPHMARDVTDFIHGCALCQKERPSPPQVDLARGQLSSYALFEELAIDFIGPLPRDDLQNAYIFNAVCCFSRFSELIPVEAATAAIAAHCLLTIVARYGCFRRIRSDRGTHFVNAVIEEFLNLFQIQNVLTLAERPQANGIAERIGGEVMRHLRALVFDARIRSIWSVVLPLVQRILNRTFREFLGCAPNALVYVQAPDLDRGLFEPFREHNALLPVSMDYLQALRDAQESLLDITAEHLAAQQRHRLAKARPVIPTVFPIGSYVLFEYLTRPPSKLHTRAAGPFQVLAHDRNNVTIADLTSGKTKVVDAGRLTPFLFSGTHAEASAVAAADLGETEVLRILDVSGNPKHRSALRFRVEWSDGDITSEPWDTVKHLALLDDYILANPEKKLGYLLPPEKKLGLLLPKKSRGWNSQSKHAK